MPTAAVMMANSATLMNDPDQLTFTNAKLLPYLKLAYQDLQLKLNVLGAGVQLDTGSSSTLAAEDKEMDPPDDLIAPIKVQERNVGGSDSDWLDLQQRRILPSIPMTDSLIYYAWNEQVFKFVGATQARDVRVIYWRNLDTITSANFNINVINAQLFLEYKTVAIYCLFPGGLPKRGADLDTQAEKYWNDAASIEVKSQQGMPARRLGYGTSRKRLGRMRGSI